MPEFRESDPIEIREAITHASLPLADGPLTLYLGDHRLQIVDPARDLDPASRIGVNPRIDCLVIDPLSFDARRSTGYKGLRDNERIALGRAHRHGRFEFSNYVSSKHVSVYRQGDMVEITDLGSTNGTFLVPSPDPDRAAGPSDWEAAGETVGNRRHPEKNQDTFFVDVAGRSVGVFDGIGGRNGSDNASALAATLVERSLREVPIIIPRGMGELAIRETLEKAHDAIVELDTALKRQDPNLPSIGTTAIIAKIFETTAGEADAVIGGAGDSRAHLIRDDRIEHMTLDHVFVGAPTAKRRSLQETLARFTDLSELTNEERRIFESRHMISSCLGGDYTQPAISVSDIKMQPGDKLLLTSDGIHDNLASGEIEETIVGASVEAAVKGLIAAAQARSQDRGHPRAKHDDMTAVMLAYHG